MSVTDVNGCGHNEQITILQTSNVAIDSIQTVTDNGCVGHCNGTVSVFPNSGLNYSIDGGVTWQTTSVFTQVCNGNYTVIIKDSYGCTNTQSVSVNASPLQTSNGSDTTICQNGNAVLSVNASGGQTPYSYNWNPSGSTNSITVSPTSTQQYTVSITDALGCQSQTSTFNVTVLPPISIAGLQNLNYCQGVTTLVSASVTGGTGNYSYSWIDLGSQQILGTASSLNFTHSGSGTVLLIVHDDCTTLPDTVSFNYTEESQPALSLASSNTMGCPPFSTTLNLNNLPASASVDWNVGGQAFSTSGSNLDFSTSNIGCEDVLIAITTESGCHFNYEFDQVFCVAPLPTALFQYSPMDLTTMNSSFDLVNQSNPSYSSLWTISPNAMISDASAFNPSVTYAFDYADSIDVCLKVTDTLGCTATICSTIVIENEFLLYVPNCFTPDDDAFNQEFIPVTNVDPTETYEFMIFNRWGEQIFQTTDPKRGWNGTYKGQKAQDGTYIWKILMTKNSKTDGNQEFVGHINLLR